MKKLIFTFGKPEGSWNAALPIGLGQVSPLVSQLLKRPQSFIDINEVPLFSLMGERSWDDDYSFNGRLLGNIKVRRLICRGRPKNFVFSLKIYWRK